MADHEENLEVITLAGGHEGLGLHVSGGTDHPMFNSNKFLDTGIFIMGIDSGSFAERDGRFKIGDRILSVDGISVESVSHRVFLNIFVNASVNHEAGELTLIVQHNAFATATAKAANFAAADIKVGSHIAAADGDGSLMQTQDQVDVSSGSRGDCKQPVINDKRPDSRLDNAFAAMAESDSDSDPAEEIDVPNGRNTRLEIDRSELGTAMDQSERWVYSRSDSLKSNSDEELRRLSESACPDFEAQTPPSADSDDAALECMDLSGISPTKTEGSGMSRSSGKSSSTPETVISSCTWRSEEEKRKTEDKIPTVAGTEGGHGEEEDATTECDRKEERSEPKVRFKEELDQKNIDQDEMEALARGPTPDELIDQVRDRLLRNEEVLASTDENHSSWRDWIAPGMLFGGIFALWAVLIIKQRK